MKLKPHLMDSLTDDNKFRDYGLLLLRIGIGLMFVTIHGFPKITGGVQTWTVLGKPFNSLTGIRSFLLSGDLWRQSRSLAAFVAGVLFRPACALMLFTMLVAATLQIRGGYGFSGASQALELGIVLLSLIFIGSGRFTLLNLLFSRKL